ncbi:MAG: ABC1 kinase family protein [Chitinophagales bacterium]
MQNSKIYRRSYRIRKAYWTAFVVMMSYFKVYLLSKFFGKSYYEKRLNGLHIKNANRVKKTILQLQGLFIKVGQLLSILTNFLPEAFQAPLDELQDKIPARPISEIRQRILTELGDTPKNLFKTFNETPIAAASIGQAHKATLKDGSVVVVKVQHANIELIAETDLHIIERLTKLTAWFFEIKGIEYTYTQVRQMIEEELDFEQEARAMQRIKENLKDEKGLVIPEVYTEFSTSRVMTTSFCEGVKINDIAQLDKWKIDKRSVSDRLVHAYCQMVFEDGFYHADPHPGNILVQKDGTIVLLDFGATASIQPVMRTGLLQLIEGAAKNDTQRIIEALKTVGFIADDKEAIRIAEKVIDAFRNFLQNEIQFEGMNLKDIKVNPFESSFFKLAMEVGIKELTNIVQVPKDYVLLNRMVTLLMGICNTLDIHSNPLEVVQPYLQKFLMNEKGDTVKFVKELVQQMATNALSLPGDLRKVLYQAHRGELEVQVVGNQERTRMLYFLGQQLIYTVLLIAVGAFTWLFYQAGELKWCQYGLGMGVFLVLMMVRAMRKAGKELKNAH